MGGTVALPLPSRRPALEANPGFVVVEKKGGNVRLMFVGGGLGEISMGLLTIGRFYICALWLTAMLLTSVTITVDLGAVFI